MSTSLCLGCGQQYAANYGRCSSCAAKLQKRYSLEASHNVTSRSTTNLSPPTSLPSSPRRSLNLPIRPEPSAARSRPAFSVESLSNAFASEDRVPLNSPASDSRTSARASPRTSTSSSVHPSVSPDAARRALNPSSESRSSSRSRTPDSRLAEPAYAPMAAGFARLGAKHSQSPANGSRASLDARMFYGPA